MWWNKPLDIQEPEQILIKTPELSELVAKMCRESELEHTYSPGSDLSHLQLHVKDASLESAKSRISHKLGVSMIRTISIAWPRRLFADLL